MQNAMSKTREQFPLSPKKIIKKTITGTIGFVIFLAFIAVCFFGTAVVSADVALLVILGIGTLLCIPVIAFVTYLYQKWYFAVYFYDLTADYIVIRKGPITPKEITIPYERIQDVYVDQDLFDRMFGLYDVHLSSATFSSGMQAHIDGVERAAADGLRAAILETIKSKNNNSRNTNN